MGVTAKRLARWALVSTQFLSVQVLVQVTTAIGSMATLWLLPKNQFAILALVYATITLFNVFTDIAGGAALMSIGGPTVGDRSRFGSVINSLLYARFLLVFPVLTVLLAWSWWTLDRLQLAPSEVALVLLLFAAISVVALRPNVSRYACLMLGAYRQVQRLDLLLSILRLTSMLVALLIHRSAAAVLVALLVVSIAQDVFTRRLLAGKVDLAAASVNEDTSRIWALMRTLAPNSILFAFQGQLGIYVLAALGSSSSVADLGALARFGILATLLSSVSQNVIAPRFSRMEAGRQLGQNYTLILTGVVVLPATLTAVALVWPMPFLWVLGPQYGDLKTEIVLAVGLFALSAVASSIYSVNIARGWLSCYSRLYIPASLAIMVAVVLSSDVTTVTGALLVSAAGTIALLATSFCDGLRGVRDARR